MVEEELAPRDSWFLVRIAMRDEAAAFRDE
jgi:hypothetical protein